MSQGSASVTEKTEPDLLMALIHDIRRHLRTAVVHTQRLEHELGSPLNPAVQEHLGQIVTAGRDMDMLLNRVALYTAVGSTREEEAEGDVCVMFDAALRRLDQRNQDAEIDAGPIRICGVRTPSSIETVLKELLDNALKFRQGPVKVTVLVEQSPAEHLFGIRDTGIGFDTQYSERIMRPLERLHPSGLYGGCGMGLAICQRTLQHLGGKLWAESKLNKGSTFWFSVPV